jgi:DNA/RNA endonuclease G (NUC1)
MKKFYTLLFVFVASLISTNTNAQYHLNLDGTNDYVRVPTYVYKIVIDPKNLRTIAFLYPNQKLDPKTIEQYVVSIGEIEDFTGINFSPKLPAQYQALEKNRAVYKEW